MSARCDCTVVAERATGISEAVAALRGGGLAVIPTDTVYGIAADAFTLAAVTALLAAKGRGRQVPPPVLVGSRRAALALVEDVSSSGSDLIDEFWPGGLTLVFRAARSLAWDLGDTRGTVAVRMPLHPVALDLLKETGPLAVSSANRTGQPPATTAAEAESQLGDAVSVYLDGGPCPGDVPSTIVDLTGPVPRLLREGVISVDRLRSVVALIVDDDLLAGSRTEVSESMAGAANGGPAGQPGPAGGADAGGVDAGGVDAGGAAARAGDGGAATGAGDGAIGAGTPASEAGQEVTVQDNAAGQAAAEQANREGA